MLWHSCMLDAQNYATGALFWQPEHWGRRWGSKLEDFIFSWNMPCLSALDSDIPFSDYRLLFQPCSSRECLLSSLPTVAWLLQRCSPAAFCVCDWPWYTCCFNIQTFLIFLPPLEFIHEYHIYTISLLTTLTSMFPPHPEIHDFLFNHFFLKFEIIM